MLFILYITGAEMSISDTVILKNDLDFFVLLQGTEFHYTGLISLYPRCNSF